MAKAGDGQKRSVQRRLDDSISFRCMTREKLKYEKTAKRLGFPSLSAWIVDLMETNGGFSLRLRRVMSGKLGQIGAHITTMASTDLSDHAKAEMRALIAEIMLLQDMLMMGESDAAEAD